MRTILTIIAGLASLALGAYVGLEILWPLPPAGERPELAPVAPLPAINRPSVVIAPVVVTIPAIRAAIDARTPRTLSGSRPGSARNPPNNLNLDWAAERGPLTVTGRPDALAMSAPLQGILRANGTLGSLAGEFALSGGGVAGALGNLGTVGGALGRQLESLANRSFDQRADIRGNLVVTSRPALTPDWRIAPNLYAQFTLSDVLVQVANFRLNISNEVRPLVDRAVQSEVTKLETNMRNSLLLEDAARTEWDRLCRAFPLGSASRGVPDLWLEVKPMRAIAAQPSFAAEAVTLLIGVEAQTRVVPSETKPTCPFPSQLEIVPQVAAGAMKFSVPIDIPFADMNRMIEAQLAGRNFPEDGAANIVVRRATVTPSGSRLLISLLLQARERSFFSLGTEAVVNVWGRPVLDRENQVVRLADVEYDVSSDAAFGMLGPAAQAAAPLLRAALADRSEIDLKPFAANAIARLDAVLGGFNKQQASVQIGAKVASLQLVGLAFDSRVLRIVAEAEGTAAVTVNELP
jgi:hypothetical protein